MVLFLLTPKMLPAHSTGRLLFRAEAELRSERDCVKELPSLAALLAVDEESSALFDSLQLREPSEPSLPPLPLRSALDHWRFFAAREKRRDCLDYVLSPRASAALSSTSATPLPRADTSCDSPRHALARSVMALSHRCCSNAIAMALNRMQDHSTRRRTIIELGQLSSATVMIIAVRCALRRWHWHTKQATAARAITMVAPAMLIDEKPQRLVSHSNAQSEKQRGFTLAQATIVNAEAAARAAFWRARQRPLSHTEDSDVEASPVDTAQAAMAPPTTELVAPAPPTIASASVLLAPAPAPASTVGAPYARRQVTMPLALEDALLASRAERQRMPPAPAGVGGASPELTCPASQATPDAGAAPSSVPSSEPV